MIWVGFLDFKLVGVFDVDKSVVLVVRVFSIFLVFRCGCLVEEFILVWWVLYEWEVDVKVLWVKFDEIVDFVGKRVILFCSKSVELNILV